MKSLLVITAAIEAATGFMLLLSPAVVAALLLGIWTDAPAAQVVGRIAGAGVLSLGVACWLARADTASGVARGLVAAMLLYNVTAVAVLSYAGLVLDFFSLILWAAVILHIVLAIWCVVCLRARPVFAADPT
jgi:hypothetical protein